MTDRSPLSAERAFPALRLLRCAGLALDSRKLLLAALGLILSWGGWYLIEGVFRPSDAAEIIPSLTERSWPKTGLDPVRLAEAVAEPFVRVVTPFVRVFAIGQGPLAFLHAILFAMWGLLVWGIVGGAIARIAAVQQASGTRIGILSALKFAGGRAVALVGAPLCSMIGIGLFAALCALLGLLYMIPGTVGETIAGVLAFLPLLAGLVMAMLLVGVAVGWPLMIATVAVEAEDAFDSLSRSYSYVYQRPILLAAYTAICLVLGILGLAVVTIFAAIIVHLAQWGLSFGGPDARIQSLYSGADPRAGLAASAHGFWVFTVRLIVHGWVYSYFFSAATMIYLLLRRDVDGASFDDIGGMDTIVEPFAPEASTEVTPQGD